MSIKSTQRIQWRRDKVRELSIKGYTQREIAAELQVSLKLVNKDLLYLKGQARSSIEHYIDEDLPLKYQNCLNALDMIVKEMWSIETRDNRELMQSRQLIKDCCVMQIELLSSATVVDRAVKFIDRRRGSATQKGEVVTDGPTGSTEIPRT